jgi:predicted MPP superfamily phosphohydrolase
MLVNEARRVERGGVPLWIAGLDDAWAGAPDAAAALRPVPAGEAVLLLTHNPDIFPTLPARATLTLAGHTHGGQVRVPWLGPPIVPSKYGQRYAEGWIVEDGRSMYVTTGVGTSIAPVRFLVRPEVALLTLGPP